MISHPFTGRREDRLIAGTGRYTADVNLPGQLHAVFVRADRASALIRSIDTSAARAAHGVVAVYTGADERAGRRAAAQRHHPSRHACHARARLAGAARRGALSAPDKAATGPPALVRALIGRNRPEILGASGSQPRL